MDDLHLGVALLASSALPSLAPAAKGLATVIGIIALVAALAAPVFSVSARMLALGGLLFAVAALMLWLLVLRMPKAEVRDE